MEPHGTHYRRLRGNQTQCPEVCSGSPSVRQGASHSCSQGNSRLALEGSELRAGEASMVRSARTTTACACIHFLINIGSSVITPQHTTMRSLLASDGSHVREPNHELPPISNEPSPIHVGEQPSPDCWLPLGYTKRGSSPRLGQQLPREAAGTVGRGCYGSKYEWHHV